jgi:hypothetical protein
MVLKVAQFLMLGIFISGCTTSAIAPTITPALAATAQPQPTVQIATPVSATVVQLATPIATVPATREVTEPVVGRLFYFHPATAATIAELRSIDLATGLVTSIVPCINPCSIIQLAIHPLNNQLFYILEPQNTPLQRSLWSSQADGAEMQQISADVWDMAQQPFSPDGSSIVISRLQAQQDTSESTTANWVLQLQNGNIQQITDWGFSIEPGTWLNNQEIIYPQASFGSPPCDWSSYVVRVQEAKPQLYARGKVVRVHHQQQQALALIEQGAAQCDQQVTPVVWMHPTKAIEPINAPFEETTAFSWSDDGEQLAFFDKKRHALRIWQKNDSNVRIVATIPSDDWVGQIIWHPDNRHLIFIANQRDVMSLQLLDTATGIQQTLVYFDGISQQIPMALCLCTSVENP